eukprot:763406-Hanusia_phi.AAC.2
MAGSSGASVLRVGPKPGILCELTDELTAYPVDYKPDCAVGGINKATTMQSLLEEIGSNKSWKLLPEGRRDMLRTSYHEVSSAGALNLRRQS